MTKQHVVSRPLIKNPALRDRLNALAVFTGIAIGGVSGVEMVIGGGFDTITPAFAFEASEPRDWYDRPIAPGMGWLTEPYIPAATTLNVSQSLGDAYPIDSYYESAPAGDLDGAPRGDGFSNAYYEPASTENALVSAADAPLSDAEIEAISAEAQSYIDEINDLYAESHAAEVIARDMPADADAKLSGNALPL